MTKEIDDNGFWLIEDNPLSKEGVFPYFGKQISPELEPDKIYYVYRPATELQDPETIKSFNAVPFTDEHEMLGEGFTKYDDKPAGGVLYNVKAENGGLYGDLKIYSEDLKEKIENGKKELSLGYLCEYELTKGVFNGQRYDAIQRNLRGNHLALVDKGRMGVDVRVYDRAITMDSMDIEIANIKKIPSGDGSPKECGADNSTLQNNGVDSMANTKTLDADKREAIREVMAIAQKPDTDFEGGEQEKLETIAKILEASEYSKSETGTANDEDPKEEEKKTEDKCGKDEDDEEKGKAKDEDDDDKGDEEKAKAEDEMPRQILKMIAKRDALVKEVEPLIGSFACDEMTEKDTAVYACKKLGLKVAEDEALATLKGFLFAQKENRNNKVYGLDSAIQTNGIDKATERYLKGV